MLHGTPLGAVFARRFDLSAASIDEIRDALATRGDMTAARERVWSRWQQARSAQEHLVVVAATPPSGSDGRLPFLAVRVLLASRIEGCADEEAVGEMRRLPLRAVLAEPERTWGVVVAAKLETMLPTMGAATAEGLLDRVRRAEPRSDPDDPYERRESVYRLALAELGLLCGRLRTATDDATAATAAAIGEGDVVAAARAHAFLAVLAALNAEYDVAEQRRADSERLLAESGLVAVPSRLSFPSLAAESLIAAAAFDGARAARCADQFARRPDDALWAASCDLAAAMSEFTFGSLDAAKGRLTRALSRTSRSGILDLVEGLSLGFLIDLHLSEGDAHRALALLNMAPDALGDHALCFSMQRAAGLLILGRDLEVLRVTDDCVRMGPRHCMRTYPPLLARRAIALTRLGREHDADRELSEALQIVARSGSVLPFMTIPRDDLRAALEGVARRRPPVDPGIRALLEKLGMVPAVSASRSVVLTRQERQLASELADGHTIAALAERNHLSVNTVKFHLRSVYRKLGVHDRAAAVAAFAAMGPQPATEKD